MNLTPSPSRQKKLSREQQALLERWLLDDSPALTYAQAQARALQEFGVKLSHGSISAFYQRRSQARVIRTPEEPPSPALHDQSVCPGSKIFDTLMELGGVAAIGARLQSGPPSLRQALQIFHVGARGVNARHLAAALHLRERAQALRALKLLASTPPTETPPSS